QGLDVGDAADGPAVQLSGGRITLEGALAQVQGLRAEGMGILAVMDGRWDLERESGELSARWIGAQTGPVERHRGEATLVAVLPASGPASIRAEVRSDGRVSAGEWGGALALDVRG